MRSTLCRPKAAAALSILLAVPLAGCPGEPEEELEHGVVWLEMKRGASETTNPYEGTAKIQVTLLYRECLIAFYEANPDYGQIGVNGDLVFGTREDGGEGWRDRLCERDNPAAIDCTVDSFDQELDSAKQLTVTYSINGNVEDLELAFGPIPTAGLAQCEAGGQPIVRVGGNGSVRGLSGSGETLWNTESFNPTEAATNQGRASRISATRSGR